MYSQQFSQAGQKDARLAKKIEEHIEEWENDGAEFVKGRRLKMNIIPLLGVTFVPWGVYCLTVGMTASKLMWDNKKVVFGLYFLVAVVWVGLLLVALHQRFRNPNPTWFTYLAVVIGVFAAAGTLYGEYAYKHYYDGYYTYNSMKYAHSLDTGRTHGSDVMDAGVLEFLPGSNVDMHRSWHFKNGDLYCVAPIVFNNQPPATQYYDFWAVGKNCCSMGASDFRCGAWGSVDAPKGLRVIDDQVLPNYRLAVQQAQALYHIQTKTPIFFEWQTDPAAWVLAKKEFGHWRIFQSVVFMFIFSLFCTTIAATQFAFIARGGLAWKQNQRMMQSLSQSPVMQAGTFQGMYNL